MLAAAPDVVDALPLDASMPPITEERAGELFDWLVAAIHMLPGLRDHQVAGLVSQRAALSEPFPIGSKELEKAFGMHRRSACSSKHRMVKLGLIEHVGHQTDGRSLYRLRMERAEEHRAVRAALDLEFAHEVGDDE